LFHARCISLRCSCHFLSFPHRSFLFYLFHGRPPILLRVPRGLVQAHSPERIETFVSLLSIFISCQRNFKYSFFRFCVSPSFFLAQFLPLPFIDSALNGEHRSMRPVLYFLIPHELFSFFFRSCAGIAFFLRTSVIFKFPQYRRD